MINVGGRGMNVGGRSINVGGRSMNVGERNINDTLPTFFLNIGNVEKQSLFFGSKSEFYFWKIILSEFQHPSTFC